MSSEEEKSTSSELQEDNSDENTEASVEEGVSSEESSEEKPNKTQTKKHKKGPRGYIRPQLTMEEFAALGIKDEEEINRVKNSVLKSDNDEVKKCFICGSTEHLARDCPKVTNSSSRLEIQTEISRKTGLPMKPHKHK
ncbi:hypothetical protein EIN_206070 [Entamoeba invadens IP1]|uniref:CCHC-type domain-containing protein n=1 Tax=Entamoeba invadens IP1 TaxID=370355 RepID=A0A0A1UD10_ENTIV|nr:hypothetical protein EIN_206070 [Entamoeba invadens IP1]ELP91630.1 hypothetical protein EIN_206070 [Entamoeba invadens IP1]|eukprot:XP_004258401.1 hypothetical protein EIN_206070 [Entamoeba invadens IP1]